jgi:hypothetical protein
VAITGTVTSTRSEYSAQLAFVTEIEDEEMLPNSAGWPLASMKFASGSSGGTVATQASGGSTAEKSADNPGARDGSGLGPCDCPSGASTGGDGGSVPDEAGPSQCIPGACSGPCPEPVTCQDPSSCDICQIANYASPGCACIAPSNCAGQPSEDGGVIVTCPHGGCLLTTIASDDNGSTIVSTTCYCLPADSSTTNPDGSVTVNPPVTTCVLP